MISALFSSTCSGRWSTGAARSRATRSAARPASARRSIAAPSPMRGGPNTSPRWRRSAPAGAAYVRLDDAASRESRAHPAAFRARGARREGRARSLNRIWHRLDAWPDVPEAMRRLYAKYRLAPVSNGNISIMVDLARHNGFSWDTVLGAEIARDYKPHPETYLASARALDLDPSACMMVAAHSSDLAAAAACGLQTAHVARLDEYGPGNGRDASRASPSISRRATRRVG